MNIYQTLCLFGIPSVLTMILTGTLGVIHSKFKNIHSETNSVKTGLQALLRSQMINDYNRWSEKGYAPVYARENFENVWEQYHNLGANGVMDDLHQKFKDLPINKPNS